MAKNKSSRDIIGEDTFHAKFLSSFITVLQMCLRYFFFTEKIVQRHIVNTV